MTYFGFAGRWPDSTDLAALEKYAAAVAGASPGDSLSEHSSCFATSMHTEDGVSVALQGGPVFLRGVLLEEPARTIAHEYLKRGTHLMAMLTGGFALAIVEQLTNRVLLAVDRMGIQKMAFATAGSGIVFSTSAEAVARFPAMNASHRLQGIFDYMLLHVVPAPDTVYENVRKLRPGTYVTFERGSVVTERYWTAPFVADHTTSFDARRGALHQGLRNAVAACKPDTRTGAFLSGGLDSSTVAGILGLVSGRPPKTFSIGFGLAEYDELEYAGIANRAFLATPHFYDVTPDDVVDTIDVIAAAFDEPFGNSSAVPTYLCARLAAANGVTTLLAGDGGDEIFGGNERYARQRIFELYWRIPRWLRSAIIQPLASIISPESRLTPLRKMRSYVDQASIPMPERLESWNLMYRTNLSNMLESDFLEMVDTRAPIRAMEDVYGSVVADSLVQRMLHFDWHYTLSDNDLRKVSTMCARAGVKVLFPMLHHDVVDVATRLPPEDLVRGLRLRSFYKRAMKDFLPAEILVKQKHGFGLPFGVWLKSHQRLADRIYGLLADLKARRIVRPAYLDHLIDDHRTGHPSYFGYVIWSLAILEAWFQAHTARDSAGPQYACQ